MLENVSEIIHPPSCQAFIAGNGWRPTRVTARQARIQEPAQACRLLPPADVHHGLAEQRVAARATVLAAAYAAHPERFPAGLPHPPAGPLEVGVHPPKTRATEETRPADVLDHERPGQLTSPHHSRLHRRGCFEA